MADTRHTRVLALAGLALVLVVSACSGGGSDAAATTTTIGAPARTTTTLAPDDGFLEEFQQRTTGDSPEGAQAALEAARSMCTALDTSTTGIAADDAANDTPESDAAVSEVLVAGTLASTFDGGVSTGLPPEVMAVIVALGSEHLCPEHMPAVVDFLGARGYRIP